MRRSGRYTTGPDTCKHWAAVLFSGFSHIETFHHDVQSLTKH
ncbi:MAG TPA: hypothetical protein ACQGQI_07955 [Xylella sp.]